MPRLRAVSPSAVSDDTDILLGVNSSFNDDATSMTTDRLLSDFTSARTKQGSTAYLVPSFSRDQGFVSADVPRPPSVTRDNLKGELLSAEECTMKKTSKNLLPSTFKVPDTSKAVSSQRIGQGHHTNECTKVSTLPAGVPSKPPLSTEFGTSSLGPRTHIVMEKAAHELGFSGSRNTNRTSDRTAAWAEASAKQTLASVSSNHRLVDVYSDEKVLEGKALLDKLLKSRSVATARSDSLSRMEEVTLLDHVPHSAGQSSEVEIHEVLPDNSLNTLASTRHLPVDHISTRSLTKDFYPTRKHSESGQVATTSLVSSVSYTPDYHHSTKNNMFAASTPVLVSAGEPAEDRSHRIRLLEEEVVSLERLNSTMRQQMDEMSSSLNGRIRELENKLSESNRASEDLRHQKDILEKRLCSVMLEEIEQCLVLLERSSRLECLTIRDQLDLKEKDPSTYLAALREVLSRLRTVFAYRMENRLLQGFSTGASMENLSSLSSLDDADQPPTTRVVRQLQDRIKKLKIANQHTRSGEESLPNSDSCHNL